MTRERTVLFPPYDPTLDRVLDRMGGALTISKQVELPDGRSDAMVVAATTEAAELFGFNERHEMIGQLLSNVHEHDAIVQMRLYSLGRLLGNSEAPTSYPAKIRRPTGEVLWVQKEVEQRMEPEGVIWITQNTVLKQNRSYTMPQLHNEAEMLHAFLTRHFPDLWEQAGDVITGRTGQSMTEYITDICDYMKPNSAIQGQSEQPSGRRRLTCVRCGFKWHSYVSHPQKCPSCKQPWDKERAWSWRKGGKEK